MKVFFDSFDKYGSLADMATRWALGGSLDFSAGTSAFGGNEVKFTHSAGDTLGSSMEYDAYFAMGGRFRWDSFASSYNDSYYLMGLHTVTSNYDDNQMHVGISCLNDGSLMLKTLNNTYTLTTASPVIQLGVDHCIEIEGYCDGAAGYARVYVDGIQVLEATGIDTYYTASRLLNFAAYFQGIFYLSEPYCISDTSAVSAIGNSRVITLQPDADTATADFSALGAGSGYVEIDDAVPGANDGDTSYIYSSTPNHKSRFGFENLPFTPLSIHGVNNVIESKKSDTGARGVTGHLYSGTTESEGAEFPPPYNAYGCHVDSYAVDPNTGVAFTEAGINALQAGVKIST